MSDITRARALLAGAALALAAGLPWAASAQSTGATLEIVTEEYAPANFSAEGGEVTGIVTETVALMAERADIAISVEMLPFMRGYEMVREAQGRCFMALWRTPARDDDFAWVGPILKDGYALFSSAGTDMEIASLQDSFGHATGAVDGWGSTEAMRAEGHPNLEIVSRDIDNLRKLQAGRLDLWLSGLLSAPWQAARENVAIKREFIVEEVDLSLACHPGTDPEILKRLGAALADLTAEGVVEGIRARYLESARAGG